MHRPGCLSVSDAEDPKGWRTIKPDEWIRQLRSFAQLTADQNSVALALASYANKRDGKNARPGLDRLAWAAHTSVITCRRTLEYLNICYLIHCEDCGIGRGHARNWTLTVHDELGPIETFEEWKEAHS